LNRDRYVMSAAVNIKEALEEASSFLTAAGIAEPESNARLLLGHVLGLSPASLLASQKEVFPADKRADWEQAISRKGLGEPAQYIIGEQEFYGLTLEVGPSVLIPRPETELLVERIAELGEGLGQEPLVADIGTGSGAIAAALKFLRPEWRVMASDISPAALQTARRNV
jgi:release factor glutamine methyltransferase